MTIYILVRGGYEYQTNKLVDTDLQTILSLMGRELTNYKSIPVFNQMEENGSYIVKKWQGDHGEYFHIEKWEV